MSANASGTCTIAADQAGNTNYTAADQVLQSLTINKGTPTISFGAQAGQTYTPGGTFAVSPLATTTSPSPVVYSSLTAGVCTIAGSTVTIVTAGTCTIAANAVAGTNYNQAAQVTQSLTINQATQTITFGAQGAQTYSSGGTFSLSPVASASSGLAVSYSSTTTGVCTVSGTTVTTVAAGTCTIAANQAGNTNYTAADQVSQSLTINKGTQTISFGAQAGQTYTPGGTFAVSPLATTPSSSPVVYSSLTAGVCTIAGSTVTIVTAGTCTIAANAVADPNYNQAAQVTQSLTINKATQTITFGANPGPKTYGDAPFAVSATTPSTSPVSFSSTTTGVCTIAGSTVTIVTAGTCIIAANAVADTNYNAAVQAAQSITINKKTQTITFGAQAAHTYSSGGTFALSPVATTTSPLAVSYSSTTPGVCTIAGTTVTMVTGGTCTIAANQAGNANYSVAPQVTQNIAIGLASQTITVTTAAPASAAGGGTFPVAATASSGLPVAVTTGGSCSGSGTSTGGSSVTITMTAPSGTCTVYYNQAGNVSYAAANQVTNTTTATGLTQTISVTTAAPATAAYASTFPVAATATSGLAVVITTGGGCTGSGSGSATITMTSASISCSVYYNQPGNAVYYAAAQVTSTTSATKADQAITVTSAPPPYASNGVSFSVAATASSGLAVAITTTGSCTGSGSASATITMNAASGDCLVHFNQAGNVGYNVAPEVVMGTAAGSGAGSCVVGEGTYTSLQFNRTGGYVGWACNRGSIDCTPTWNSQPGSGFKGHVLQTRNDPGKTFKFQLAPDGSGYYNIINMTDNTCWVLGDAIYENSGTRTGSGPNAGYLTAIQDSATLPSAPCDYSASTAKWILTASGSGMTILAKGNGGFYGDNGSGGFYIGTDSLGLSRTTGLMDFGYSDWGDGFVCSTSTYPFPACPKDGSGRQMTCGGYQPLPPDHIRFEFNSNALTCQSSAVTIMACTNVAGIPGAASTCSPYAGYISLRPGATKGTWGGLTSAPTTGFTGTSSGITLLDTTAESTTFSYSSPSVALTNAAPECYNTDTGLVVSCTSALAFSACTFDAVESKTGSAPGDHMYTKLANTPFAFDVLMTVGSALATTYSSSAVRVELYDVTNGVAVQDVGTFSFPAGTGKITVSSSWQTALTNVAVGNAKMRIRDNAISSSTCNAANYCGTSSNAFTIRPQTLTVTLANSGDPLVSGRNTNISATPPSTGFTLTASSGVNSGYTNVPTVDTTQVINLTGITAITAADLTGNFSVDASGIAPLGTFYYNNFGLVDFSRVNTVVDKTFTTLSGDQAGGDCIASSTTNTISGGKYGCWIGSSIPTPSQSKPFRPAYYTAVVSATSPGTCGLTYVGQTYSTATLSLKANTANGDQPSLLNAGAANARSFYVSGYNWSGGVASAVGALGFAYGPSPGVNLPTSATASTAWAAGQFTLSGITTLKPISIYPGSPAVPPSDNLAIALTVNDPDGAVFNPNTSTPAGCTDGVGTPTNGFIYNVAGISTTCVAPASQTSKVYSGILKIENSYGSELLDLFVPVKALYYDGSSWKPYTLDNCTTLSPDRITISNNQTGALASHPVAQSGLWMVNSSGGAALFGQTPSQSVKLVSGMAMIKIPKPSYTGGVDIALNLGVVVQNSSCATLPDLPSPPATDLSFLRGSWCLTSGVSTKTRDPNARITFGTPKNSYIYMREKY